VPSAGLPYTKYMAAYGVMVAKPLRRAAASKSKPIESASVVGIVSTIDSKLLISFNVVNETCNDVTSPAAVEDVENVTLRKALSTVNCVTISLPTYVFGLYA